MPRFDKVLVANRGEIACRVLKTARAMGYQTVAVYSSADADAPFVRLADEAVCIGGAAPADSYLNVAAILSAAEQTGADALHPGYGFLSENADFARACCEAGLVFVGPPVEAIHVMGDKARAKQRMREAGVPTVPGCCGAPEQLLAQAGQVGFPLLVKATAGGGGRGIRVVSGASELPEALRSARAEAEAAFGDGTLMLERLVARGRHVELQVLADAHGHAVHLGERDCTAQRRRQKVIEEAPSPIVSPALRARMGDAAVAAALAVGYRGAGTVEMMVDPAGSFYFLEMNTRLQVEHPVTELVTGLDLVRLQLAIAEGQPLPFAQDDVKLTGHAVEVRLYAEDPYAGFTPQTGPIPSFPVAQAESLGVRVDAGVESGSVVTPHYDALVAKLIAHAPTREEAVRKLCRALQAAPLYGLRNNASFLVDLLQSEPFQHAAMYTSLLDEWVAEGHALLQEKHPRDEDWLLAAALLCGASERLRSGSAGELTLTLVCRGERKTLTLTREGKNVRSHGQTLTLLALHAQTVRYEFAGVQRSVGYLRADGKVHLASPGGPFQFEEPSARRGAADSHDPRVVRAPLAGSLLAVRVAAGDEVKQGDVLAVIEAMKMETRIVARVAGTVRRVLREVGAQVAAGEQLFALADEEQS